jgi:hypothetical protein
MNFSRLLTFALWFLPLALQCAIAVSMVYRGLVRQFPFFFTYTVFVTARDLVLTSLPYGRNAYSTVFWWGEAAAILLSLVVIFEVGFHLVGRYPFLRFILKALSIAGVIAAIGALAMLFWTQGPAGANLALERIIFTERSVRFLQACLLILTLALMSRLGLTWRNYALGIAAGFGVYSALDLTLLELRAHLHAVTDNSFVLLRSAAYNLGVLIWAAYFLLPLGEGVINRLPDNDLGQWNDELNQKVDKWYRR